MKILSTARYNELLEYEKKVKQASNEVQRKEFCIQRKQKTINNIDKQLNKLPNNPKKDELKAAIDRIGEEINK